MNYKAPKLTLEKSFLASISDAVFLLLNAYKKQKIQKQIASKNIGRGFGNCIRGIKGLDQTLVYLKHDVVILFGRDIPKKLKQNMDGLQHVKQKNHYLYSSCMISLNIISQRYDSIESKLKSFIASNNQNDSKKMDPKNIIQDEIMQLKNDLMTLAETEMQLLECISSKFPCKEILILRKMKKNIQEIYNSKTLGNSFANNLY